ncbi:hypothetical protein GJV85_06600 [Sulfurimonas aquatica]|uniref:Peptidoglycan synthetase n=1 Tax=Sulfurimonas aquatica TaxID=2672570 RepID=A0A975B0B8_9BACT|nr:hypothetical protein [Sulfurimonas aquatica]QSZ41790.1 hypothetical protein GJV85_06600 [Sulfurimonas aquatica]
MRLENILALTLGKLVNNPFVNNFENIVFDSKNIKRGDLFVAFNEEEISDAILNGAYGIIFDKPTQISDNEIAWIKVDNLEKALKRLLRFRLIDKNVTVYESNEIVIKLAQQVITESNFIALIGNIKTIVKSLWNIEQDSIILFCPTLIDKNIFARTIELSQNPYQHVDIIEQTLFETSFIYNNIFYERQLISPFFMPYLEILLHLFKKEAIHYRLKKFSQIDHFEAVFTNKKLEVKEFGTSDKVLIFEKNTSFIEQEINFLQRNATWAKIIYLIPNSHANLRVNLNEINTIIVYKNESDILRILKSSHFHFALILGVDKAMITKPISNQTEVSLFDL